MIAQLFSLNYYYHMKYRTLGKTGLKVSEIGYGTWQLADDPNMWVGADLNQSLKNLHRFVELGGNFIDTAWIYGYSDDQPDKHPSEELIGKFLKESGKRDQVVLATKVPPKNMFWPARQGLSISEVFPKDWIEKCVDDSLNSLRVETIDLVQFHVWQDYFAKEDEWKETIQRIIRSGKVKYWGISLNDYQPSNCLKTLDTGLISTIQFIFNLFHQKPTEKLLPYAKQHNIGLIARVPLDEGGLSGKFTKETTFPEGDLRKKFFAGSRLVELVERTDELKKLLNDEAESLPDLDLRYIL
ncbi:MAG: aldo/keto reductase, partial [Nanoarchaeota archaeon]